MAARFQTVIRRARFKVNAVAPEDMAYVGRQVLDGMFRRWDTALDIHDAPAPPLKEMIPGKGGYKARKARKGMKPIRDLLFTGRMRRSIKVLMASNNTATLGGTDATTIIRIRMNNKRARQWGMSPKDGQNFRTAFRPIMNRSVSTTQGV